MSKIHVLSEQLTNMIAAGEVVDRPVNIVKECVENSIDAQATSIDIQVFQGGIDRIIIKDNGHGMDAEDAQLAFMRHATSKISSEMDLFNISTMGFRGEAMPSIASVAHVECTTSTEEQGTRIVYDYGDLVTNETCSCPRGTTIDVSGLFIKTPARFKHLRSVSYEFSIIADIVNKFALSHPDIRFTLSHENHIVFQTTGNGDIQEILYQMYGREVAKNAISFQGENDDFRIQGYAVQPKINRATKYFIFITLNGRLIRHIPIQKAIIEAYSDYLPMNRYPIVVLQISSDTQLVDVNVHPNKWEVRLSKQNEVIPLVQSTIKEALRASLQTVEIKQVKQTPRFEQPKMEFEERPQPQLEIRTEPKQTADIDQGFETYTQVVTPQESIKVQEEVVEPEMEEVKQGPTFFEHLEILSQLHDSYILCSNPEGLVIIDQHAAQERYHYEQLLDLVSQPTTKTQPLMVPIQLDVSMDTLSQIQDINEKISYFGLHFEPFGNDQVLVREIPMWFHDVDQLRFLQDILDYFKQNQDVDILALRHKVIATMACHSSIRFNRKLTMGEMKQVILDLQKCKQPYHCPHGRPTVITMSDSDLRKEFERG